MNTFICFTANINISTTIYIRKYVILGCLYTIYRHLVYNIYIIVWLQFVHTSLCNVMNSNDHRVAEIVELWITVMV